MPSAGLRLAAAAFVALSAIGCSSNNEVSSDGNPGSTAGSGGQQGDASPEGAAGDDGSAGSGGSGATGGTGGSGGSGATGGTGGSGGTSTGGTGGSGGTSTGGTGGSGGTSTGGTGGAGGTGTGGTGGSGGTSTGGTGGSGGGTPSPCTSDADCSGSASCQIVPDDTNSALELRCMPLAGPSGNGVPCTAPADCRSGQCILGYCASPCTSASDCTQAGTCRPETITVGALFADFDLCVVAPCTSTAQCDPGEVCSDVRSEGSELKAYCRQGSPGGSALGETCAVAGDCASLLCPSWLLSCTEMCSADADCAAAPNQGCVDVFNNGTSVVPGCATLCDSASDCSAPSTCAIATDTAGNRHRFTCSTGFGTDPVGADCSVQNQCASGLCLSNYENGQLTDKICTAPCNNGAADCPAGFQVCVDVTMQTPNGTGTETLSLCNHP